MPVVINEFDVLVEPPVATNGAQPSDQEERPQEPQLTPADIREIERHLAERCARLRAH